MDMFCMSFRPQIGSGSAVPNQTRIDDEIEETVPGLAHDLPHSITERDSGGMVPHGPLLHTSPDVRRHRAQDAPVINRVGVRAPISKHNRACETHNGVIQLPGIAARPPRPLGSARPDPTRPLGSARPTRPAVGARACEFDSLSHL